MLSRFLVVFLDFYAYWLNFFKLHNVAYEKLKKATFEGKYSYITFLTPTSQLVMYDYENVNILYLAFLYCMVKFGFLYLIPVTDAMMIQQYMSSSVQYAITTHYEDNRRIENIISPSSGTTNDIQLGIQFLALLNDHDDRIDITRFINMYKRSLVNEDISVGDFVRVLQARRLIHMKYIFDPSITIMDLCTFQEQVFKANDVIRI